MRNQVVSHKERLNARVELLAAEKELTRQRDALNVRARSRRDLGRVPVARRAPEGRNETGYWWRRYDEYDSR
jgi:predicted dithiol-disulfide oxidoreductase (DUF899 family)